MYQAFRTTADMHNNIVNLVPLACLKWVRGYRSPLYEHRRRCPKDNYTVT